jgi:hypothetical protein
MNLQYNFNIYDGYIQPICIQVRNAHEKMGV